MRDCTGPAWARFRPPSSLSGGCSRSRTRAWIGSAVDSGDADRLLGIIERRCVSLRNGAAWQSQVFHSLYDGKGLDRQEALREMTRRYREHMHSNAPVHEWPTG